MGNPDLFAVGRGSRNRVALPNRSHISDVSRSSGGQSNTVICSRGISATIAAAPRTAEFGLRPDRNLREGRI